MITRKRLRGVLQIAISVALLTIILRQVHWTEVTAALRRIEPGWLALAWGMFALGVVVRAARWQTLLVALGIRRSLSELSAWYFVGGFFNVVLPTGFGGDAVRVAELAQDTHRLDLAVNSVVVDRYLGLMVLLAMGLIGGLARARRCAGRRGVVHGGAFRRRADCGSRAGDALVGRVSRAPRPDREDWSRF